MKRRDLLLAASTLAAAPMAAAAQADTGKAGTSREYYELRKYHLLNRSSISRFDTFLRDAAIPALNRLGVERVGVFSVLYGPNIPTAALFLLLPYKSLESWAAAKDALIADAEFMRAGAEVLDTPISEPAYVRAESSLMLAFEQMPALELPPQTAGKKPRLFELRTYESHSVKAGRKKIEMFNQGGEIELFRKTGLNPVFFGETLVGPQLPNLTYMLCHDNMQTRDASWDRFVKHPGWLELLKVEKYKDTVSNITDIILRPTAYSQI
jgi:hypothetical protein